MSVPSQIVHLLGKGEIEAMSLLRHDILPLCAVAALK